MISYDTNVLIYALGTPQQWSDAAREVVVAGEKQGAVLSVLLWQEFFAGLNLSQLNSEHARKIFGEFTSTNFVPVTQAVVEKSIELTKMSDYKLKNYDAILIATAIVHGATEFWTNDKQILKFASEEIIIKSL